MKKSVIVFALAFVLLASLSVPTAARAQSALYYQPRTTSEMVAYLYGRIAQLLEIKQLLEQGGGRVTTSSAIPVFSQVSITTHSATEITNTTAVLRGEAELYGEATASVWFEYGQDEDFLDQKTRKVSVKTAYDRAVRTKVSYLEEDERYYFRMVATDKNDHIYYGKIFGFRTDEAD